MYPMSDLASLDGLKAGAKNPVSMIDGFNFMGAKAYKDSKLCVEMFSHMLHERYHRQTRASPFRRPTWVRSWTRSCSRTRRRSTRSGWFLPSSKVSPPPPAA